MVTPWSRALAADPVSWLLASHPWTRYRTLVDLLAQPATAVEVLAARQALHEHPLVLELIATAGLWPDPPLKRHNDASHPLHSLTVCADLGVDARHLREPLQRLAARSSPAGPYLSLIQLSKRYTGREGDASAWFACDAPTLLNVVLSYDLGQDGGAQRALEHLAQSARPEGYLCSVSAELGRFHGPGRRTDPCPIANLLALRALSLAQEPAHAGAARAAREMLLWHWEHQSERKLYLFGIGTDYRKLKYPMLWYDILHGTEVLSRFPEVHGDERFQAMLSTILAQQDERGRFTAGSMYRHWKGWDFADKSAPSPWLTFLVCRILQRVAASGHLPSTLPSA